nr:hypothetical protein [Candidatus Sigynarchaeota archaeon]
MADVKGWEYLLAEICIIMCLVFAIFYFNKARKTEENMKTLKQLNIGLGILFLFLFICRVLDNPIGTMLDPARNVDLFGIELGNLDLHNIFTFFDYDTPIIGSIIIMGYFTNMFFLLGLAIATFFMERAFIPKAHHIFFIFLITCAFVTFLAGPITGQMIDIFDTNWDDPVATVFTVMGFLSFAVIPIIYFILAGKTTGDLRRNSLFLAFGFIMILVDMHTVGHASSGNWYRSVPCLLGFLFVGLGNVQR